MPAIKISFENGNVTVSSSSNFSESPVVFTQAESVAVSIIESALQEIHIPLSEICYQRRSDKYLSVITHEFYDFLRIKVGAHTCWFSVLLSPNARQKFSSDPRFSSQKNKRQTHWKILLNSVSDLSSHKDLIQAGYKSALFSYEMTR